ncbi:hypothetical protein SAMN05216251_108201 [Actinacidiphila alni]|uniref:Uncharacterized protein n=1 Tax=Actinacidiphila alni TaxID=380248 RepID=A0A1I2G0U4_9ACTN|nr:hypothetical protein [Actinacidiphila alni]SFF11142.1 hypothetical protein SAMN05216251_108201 [Actinacidiphila alni]
MNEPTGHALDTGAGPVLLDHPVGRGVESPSVAAWRAYIEHTRSGCDECRTSTRTCPTANELWAAYSKAGRTA